nr:ATP-grasp fold amidoligase family protein [uncultured Carboxylicivirga sp.]
MKSLLKKIYWLVIFSKEQFRYHLRKFIFLIPIFRHTYFARQFFKTHKYKLNLKNPQTFLEKLNWINLFQSNDLGKYADKFAVREYVKNKIGKQHLIPTYGVYDKVKDINFNQLPNKFIIKATHASGWNIIVKDKDNTNWFIYKRLMNFWVKANFFKKEGELCYRNIKGRIIIEKYMETFNDDLVDYKFWCFNGKIEFIGVYGNRQKKLRGIILDNNWKELPIRYPNIDKYDNIPDKPENLKEMISKAEILSSKFPFVRVDLYSVNDNIYFGELTFMPGIGLNIRFPKELDNYYGKLLKIP